MQLLGNAMIDFMCLHVRGICMYMLSVLEFKARRAGVLGRPPLKRAWQESGSQVSNSKML